MNARWKFWLISLSALLTVTTTLSLARWQLSRAAQKEALQASIEHQALLPRLDGRLLAASAEPQSQLHRAVALRGRWIEAHTVFLDNRQMDGKEGWYVLTPLQIEGSPRVVLVQRGWVARNFIDRTGLPPIATTRGEVQIEGRIAPSPAKLYQLGQPQSGRIRQNLDLAEFALETGLPLLPVSVLQTGVTGEGLLRDWPQIGVGIEKHYAYAFQWFALSALVAFLYVWFQIVRRFISSHRA